MLHQRIIETVRLIDQTVNEHGVITEPLVLAVSGGVDSTALMHVLADLCVSGQCRKVIVAHFNHMLRSDASDADETFVVSEARRLGLHVETAREDILAVANRERTSIEQAARTKRYAFLVDVAKRNHAKIVLLAHHANDQAETFLWRLMRGSGAEGLSGMSPVRVESGMHYVRPFLDVQKKDLIAFCQNRGIAWREDESNQSTEMTRNAIRLELIPWLIEKNPNIITTLVHNAEIVKEEDRWFNQLTEEWFHQHVNVEVEPSKIRMNRLDYVKAPIALQRRVIKLIWRYLHADLKRLSFARIEALREAILKADKPNSIHNLSDHVEMIRAYETIYFINKTEYFINSQNVETKTDELLKEWPEVTWNLLSTKQIELPLGTFHVEFILDNAEVDATKAGRSLGRAKWVAYFSLNEIGEQILIRSRRTGDRIELASGGHQKIKQLMIDSKLPVRQRSVWPILTDQNNRILWLPGMKQMGSRLNEKGNDRLIRIQFVPNIE